MTDGVFKQACAGDELRIAWAFQRRSVLGNSLTAQPYDTLFDVFISFISILTPLRFLTLCNCAWRLVRGITDTHFSAHRSSLDVEAFFADLRLANMTSIRIQRLHPCPLLRVALHFTFCCGRQLGLQVLVVAVSNVVLTLMCLIQYQLFEAQHCFQLPGGLFPRAVGLYQLVFNALRIVVVTFALGCFLIPICMYNYSIRRLAVKVIVLPLQSQKKTFYPPPLPHLASTLLPPPPSVVT